MKTGRSLNGHARGRRPQDATMVDQSNRKYERHLQRRRATDTYIGPLRAVPARAITKRAAAAGCLLTLAVMWGAIATWLRLIDVSGRSSSTR